MRKSVSVVATFNPAGHMLWGRRNDNGLWTTPAGHVEAGETPHAGAHRELYEEAGLHPDKPLEKVASGKGGPKDELDIHLFRGTASGTPTTEHDPDDEVDRWKWIDVSRGLPPAMLKKLHVPHDKNLILKHMPELKGDHSGAAFKDMAAL